MTERHEPQRFAGDCKRFLQRLNAAADGAAPPAHAAECERCRDLWAAARRHARVLTQLERPALPEQVRSPEFLAGIYERATSAEPRLAEALGAALTPVRAPAAARSAEFLAGIYERSSEMTEEQLGDTLRAGLQPVAAPTDAVWLDVADREDVASSLRGMPAARTPGWMRQRIRAAIEDASTPRHEPVFTPARVGLLAAAVLVSALLFVRVGSGDPIHRPNPGAEFNVRFEVSSEPFDPGFSLDGVLVGR